MKNRVIYPRHTFSGLSLSITLGVALPLLSCSQETTYAQDMASQANHGAVELRVSAPDELSISLLKYTILRQGKTIRQETINYKKEKKEALGTVYLPSGPGYEIKIEAWDVHEKIRCHGTAPFSVHNDMTTGVAVTLNCRALDAPGDGKLEVDLSFNQCPVVNNLVFSPTKAKVHERINVGGSATDPDSEQLSFTWKDDDVSFSASPLT